MHYLLDTNICIYLIKQKPPEVLQQFEKHNPGDIAISSITLAELRHGVEKSQHTKRNHMALEEFILPLEILPFDDMAAFHYGSIRRQLESQGIPIGAMDLVIAAHAKSLDLTVVTNNEKEFCRIPELKVENWALTPLLRT